MRIVRIADLSEEERKKALEKQEERYQSNENARKAEVERVNKLFETQSRIQEKMDRTYENKSDKSFSDRLKYIGSNLGTGILSGTAGIGQSGLTDMANQMNKGKEKNIGKALLDTANSIIGLTNPLQMTNNIIKNAPTYIKDVQNVANNKNISVKDKIVNVGLNATTATIDAQPIKDVFNTTGQLIGKINPNASNALLDVNNMISKPIQEQQRKLSEEAQEYDKVTQTIGNVSQVIGNMIPSVGASALTGNPNIGLATMALSTKGQATQEALNKGAELDQAVKIGNTKAIIELGTEMLTGGVNIFGKGAVDDIIQKGIDKRVKNEVANFLLKRGLDIPGEIVEETISDVLGTTIDKGTVDPNATYSFQDFGDTALTTMLSTVVLNAITGGYGKNAYNTNKANILPKAQDIANNNNVLPTAQTIQTQNQVAQNSISEQINNNIANNQEALYNNNESESGINGTINGRTQETTLGGDISESRLFEEHKQKQYSEQNYREWEKSIKSKQDNELTYEEQELKNDIKKSQNKDVIFIKEDNGKGYYAGASLDNSNIVYIKTEDAKKFGLKRTALHETMESNIRFANETTQDIIMSTIEDMISDSSFEKQKIEFWKDQEGELPSDTAIAKDIICDRLAELNGEKLDYENVLSEDVINRIDMSIEYFKQELENASSFSMKDTDNFAQTAEYNIAERARIEKNEIKVNNKEGSSINPYKNAAKVNKLNKEKNEKIRQLRQNLINVSSEKYKKKIKQDIKNIENEYNDKIQNLYDEINNKEERSKKITKKEVRQQLLKDMNINVEDIQIGNDIKSLNFQLTDPIRVNEKVFGRELGQKINNATINITKHNTAEKTRWLNRERNEINKLNIKARSKESAAVQKYGERQYVDKNGNIIKYGDEELALDFPNKEKQANIKRAAEVIRNKYDIYIDQINEIITSLGYDQIPKRKDYMRHFQELGDIFSQTGVPFNLNDMKVEDLPTDINGLTEFNKPGKSWFAQAQRRNGNKTTYDAITGIDGYLEGAGNLIYHTEDIQKYRALSELVRDTFGQTKGFDNLDNLSDEQVQQRIEDIQNNRLSKYAAWLDEQANNLAGKKGAIDRGFERVLGRKAYTLMNTLKRQVGSNMTGFNVRSSLTNFISATIAAAKTNKIALARGTVSTINNIFHNDGFVDKSDFLTSRFGSNSISQKMWQKFSNAGQIFMNGSDYFTANLIARSKYFEGLQKGMTEIEAMNYSNDFSGRVMGDRSQGATAEAFNSKTLGLLTQFQLEVNNQWQYMIHDTKMDYQRNSQTEGKAKASATVLFQLGQIAAYSYLFNELFEKVTGSRAAFDPIEIVKTLFGVDDEDDEKSFEERATEAMGMLVDNLPLGNLITGGGRIPISDALTGTKTLVKKITGQKNSYGGDITWENVGKDMLSSAPYWVLPTGYGQAKKTVQGLNTMINNGDYATNSKGEQELRFPVEDANVGDYIRAGLFGKYSLPTAKNYVNRDYKRLSAKQTKAYESSGLSYKEYLNYIDADLKNKEEKINYINEQDWTYEQKWNLYKNDLLSSTERKDGSSQLSDAEYIVLHGVSKKEFIKLYNKAYKNGIGMPTEREYKEMQKEGISLEKYINDKINKN